MKVDGQCHCGAIAYKAEIDPAKSQVCHCTDCQVLTGTVYRVHLRLDRSQMPGSSQIFNNHIPVDPQLAGLLSITDLARALEIGRPRRPVKA